MRVTLAGGAQLRGADGGGAVGAPVEHGGRRLAAAAVARDQRRVGLVAAML